MLKRIALILCLVLLPCLLLTACGGDGAATSESATEAKTAAATEERTNAETNAATEPVTAAATEERTSAETNAATDPATEPITEPATTDDGIYTVTFSIDGNETSFEVPRGETPVCPAELLTWETAANYCKVTGWDKEIVPAEADVTYTATVGRYGLTVYDVRFNLKTGIISMPTHEGEIPTPPAGYETDLTRVDKIGAFVRWNPELVAPTAENMEGKKTMVFTPVYTYTTRYYNVTFVINGTEHSVKVAGNTVPVCPADPAEVCADDFTVRFTGWDKEVVAAKEDAVYTAVYGSAAEILLVKDGAKGILTMTYDDGRYQTAVWVNEKNKEYGLTGSCMMVPNWSRCNPDFTFDGGSIAKWNALFADGTLEPQSHSTSHEGTGILADETGNQEVWELRKYNNYQENYAYELVQARDEIKAAFPNYDPICFAPSNNTLSHVSWRTDGKGNLVKDSSGEYILDQDGGATKVAEETYYAIRKGNRGVQTLDPAPNGTAGGWYNLRIRAFKDHSGDEKLTQGKSWLDETVRDGNWLIVMCHGITATGGDIKQSLAEEFFAYAGNYIKNGDLWAATFGDATKYIRERQNTTVSETFVDNTVRVRMTINRTTEDGKYLDRDVFNYPLTVKVRVPDDWKTVSYRLKKETVNAAVYVDAADGCSYVNVNVVPGADGVTTTTVVNFVN